ncbi:wax ester/triacylglycerol synthase domain-containing protein [Streptomyces sp. NPDC003514]
MRLTAIEEGHLRNGMPGTIGIAGLFPADGPPIDLAWLRARVRERWGGLERMSLALRPPAGPAAFSGHRWAARPFDPAAHIASDDRDLHTLLTDAVSRPLPEDRPLWRLLVTERATAHGERAVVLLAHHALLDGRSLETLFRLLMDDAVPPRPPVPDAPPRRRPVRPATVGRELRVIGARGRALPASPAERYAPSVAVVRLDAPVMRAARRQPEAGRGATLNELLLSSFSGALRARYGPLRAWPAGPAPFFGTVPVDLRGRHDAQRLGNGVTALRIPLPVDLDSPVARLRACQEEVAAFDHRCDAHRAILPPLLATARAMPWLAEVMARRLARPELTTSLCTAFKWRDNPSRLHGNTLARVVPLPQLATPGTANLCLVHCADTYTLTVVSHLRDGEADLLGGAVARELAAVAACEAPAARPAREVRAR